MMERSVLVYEEDDDRETVNEGIRALKRKKRQKAPHVNNKSFEKM